MNKKNLIAWPWLYCLLGSLFYSQALLSLQYGSSCFLKVKGQQQYLTALTPYGTLQDSTRVNGLPGINPGICFAYRMEPSYIGGTFTNKIGLTNAKQAGSRWTLRFTNVALGTEMPSTEALTSTPTPCYFENTGLKNFVYLNSKNQGAGQTTDLPACIVSYGYSPANGLPGLFSSAISFNNGTLTFAGNSILSTSPTAPLEFEIEDELLLPTLDSEQQKNKRILECRGFRTTNFRAARVFAFLDQNMKRHIYALGSSTDGKTGLIYELNTAQNGFDLFNFTVKSPTTAGASFGMASADMWAAELDMAPDGKFLCSNGGQSMLSFVISTNQLNLTNNAFVNPRFAFLPQNCIPTGIKPAVSNPLEEISLYNIYAFVPEANRKTKKSAVVGNDNVSAEIAPDGKSVIVTVNGTAKTFPPLSLADADYLSFNGGTIQALWLDNAGYIWIFDGRSIGFIHHYSDPVNAAPAPTLWRTYLSMPEEFWNKRQRFTLFGPNNTLYAIKMSQGEESEILQYDGVWKTLATPGQPICISTDDELNLYILTNTGALHAYVQNTWKQITYNATALPEPIVKFKIAGSADSFNVICVSCSGGLHAGTGSISKGLQLNSLSFKPEVHGVNDRLTGIIDATIAADGTMLCILKDKNLDPQGTVWIGSLNNANNEQFVKQELKNQPENF